MAQVLTIPHSTFGSRNGTSSVHVGNSCCWRTCWSRCPKTSKNTHQRMQFWMFWSQTNYGPVPPSANKLSRSLTHRPGTGSPKRFHGIRIRQLCDRILSSTVKIVKAVCRVWGSTEDVAPKSQLRHSDQMERTPSSAADDLGQNCTVDLVQSWTTLKRLVDTSGFLVLAVSICPVQTFRNRSTISEMYGPVSGRVKYEWTSRWILLNYKNVCGANC